MILGFEGIYCDVNINDCEGKTCPPPKLCIDLIDGYECHCPPGYGGEDCSQLVNPCMTATCLHGGTCSINGTTNNYQCSCTEGYTGK